MAAAARAADGRPHGMLSVVGLEDAGLEAACREAVAKLGGETVCEVANKLFPTVRGHRVCARGRRGESSELKGVGAKQRAVTGRRPKQSAANTNANTNALQPQHKHTRTQSHKQGRVVSGHLDALDLVAAAALEKGALKAARLAVSGAFHTRLMAPARAALEAALARARVAAPRVPVISNVTGAPFPSDPDAIRALLARQLVEPVQWEATLAALTAPGAFGAAAAAAGGDNQQGKGHAGQGDKVEGEGAAGALLVLHELGPGAQLKSMVRRVSPAAWRAMVNVGASA